MLKESPVREDVMVIDPVLTVQVGCVKVAVGTDGVVG